MALDVNDTHILKSYSLVKNASTEELSSQILSEEIRSSNLAWAHLDATNPKTKEWLMKECNYLDHIIVNGLLADETRPRIEKINDGLFMILRCVNLNENADPEDMISIRLWIDPNRIISVQKRNTKSIEDMEKLILSGHAPNNAGDFLCLLLNSIFKRMEPILGSLDTIMDEVEAALLENPSADLRGDLVNIRKQAIIFRRFMMPQREVFSELRFISIPWISELQRRELQENYDHSMRYVEDLDSLKDRAQIIKDELSNLLSDKINKNMYILSVIAAIFLPLSFLTGLLGTNIRGIPGANHPYAFYIFSFILLTVVTFQVFLFKKLKWF